MTEALYVERETCPSVIPGEEIMVVSRQKGSEGAPPRFYVVALDSNTVVELRTGQGPDVNSFTVASTSSAMERGNKTFISIDSSVIAADHNIYVLRCLSGRLAVTIVSPHEVQMQFRSRGR